MSLTDPLENELNSLGSSLAMQVIAAGSVAQRVLERIAGELDGAGATSSPIITVSEGAMVRIDGVQDDPTTRRHLADLIRRVLDDAGIDGDSLVLHPVDGLADLDSCPRAVVLRLFPPPEHKGGPLPPAWVDMAAEWVFGDLAPDSMVRLRVLGAERRVRVAEAAGVLHTCAAGGAWCDAITGDIIDRVRTASISFGTAPHVAIAAGGPGCDDDGLLARFELLAGVAAELADRAAYACIDFEPAFDQLALGLATAAWTRAGHAPANRVVGERGDRAVPEAYPFQVLGPSHRAILDESGVHLDRTETAGDRTIVRIGDPQLWLADRPSRETARSQGWDLLAPLLLERDDLGERVETARATPQGSGGLPDLQHIVIEAGPHPRRGTRLSPLELAAWLAGESHSDEPKIVGPVLSALLRGLARGLSPERRPALKDLVPAAVTSTTKEGDRGRDVVGWLVRNQAATWLSRSGVTGLGERLAGIGDVASVDGSRRAVALLSDALVTAQRRLDITTAIAGDHADLVESSAWAAWEWAADASGWSAASDAATVEAPSELAAEIDRRLVDSSRERASGSIDDGATTVWSAAYSELGAFAWHRAWDRAERHVRAASAFSVRTTIHAHLDEALAGSDLDPDQVADSIDRAAGEALSKAIQLGHRDDPFDLAQTAETGAAGTAWRDAVAMARRMIGESDFDDSVEQARRELDLWFNAGQRLVIHLTVTALARETAGVAARAIAARAAAECAAKGGSYTESEAAAIQELAPVVGELADAVVMLAGQLCEPGWTTPPSSAETT